MANKKIVVLLLIIVFIVLMIVIFFGLIFRGSLVAKNDTNVIEDISVIENGFNNVYEKETGVIDGEKLSEIVDRNDLFGKYYDKAKDIINGMTIEEKIGQMFLARYPEDGANDEISKCNPGGYILFGRDFKNENKESILGKIKDNQNNSKIKLFFGVDEEGGTVVRVSDYTQFRSSKFKSALELYREGGIDRILEDSHEKSELLKSLGINLNLAPVVDVSSEPDSFIYNRTIGQGVEETARYAKELVEVMQEDKILSTLKHFPRIWK